jgi:hypothetical protein
MAAARTRDVTRERKTTGKLKPIARPEGGEYSVTYRRGAGTTPPADHKVEIADNGTVAISAGGKTLTMTQRDARSLAKAILAALIGMVAFVGGSDDAHAQAKIVPTGDVPAAGEADIQGWNPFLALTGTISLTSNSNVVGQVDGFSTLFGVGVTGGADFVKNKHLFRSTLAINESFARTPVVDQFVKTNDVVKLEGLYNYFFTKELGAYGRASISTSLFPATDVRGLDTTWVEKNQADPTMPIPLAMNAREQRLAGSFAPFSIEESAGGFADPIRGDKLNLSFRLGMGGRHTIADSVLLIDDDDATPEVELLRLSNVHQLGAEVFAGANGKLAKDGKLTYRAGLSALLPFVNNDSSSRSAVDLMRIGFEGQLSFNVYSWMSLVYSVAITRDPQLFPDGQELIQYQNTALLTFQFGLVKKTEKPKEPTKEELELADAKARAEAAEKRALEAEEKLRMATPPPAVEPTPTTEPAPAPAPAPTTP